MSFTAAGRGAKRNTIAWLGLLLMAISFAWLQLVPSPNDSLTSEKRSGLQPAPVGLVVIDAGHGGQDSGTMRNGVLEKDLSLDVALRIEGLARVHGFRTLLTRTNDSWISLAERAALANREDDCIFVSIHFDEAARPAATGVQTFYAIREVPKTLAPSWLPFLLPAVSSEVNLESESLAGLVQASLVARTHAFDRGTRPENFYVVANVRHPAVLVEGGFLSNNDDFAKVTNGDYRQELAAAITDGLVRYRDIVNQRGQTLAAATR